MITSDLIEYIKSQLDNNISKSLIISDLSQVGWHISDIEEGFSKIEADKINSQVKYENKINDSEVKIDPYRELPDMIDHSSEKIGIIDNPLKIVSTVEPTKIWTPIVIVPQEEEVVEVKEPEKPIKNTVDPVQEIDLSPIKEEGPTKIWTPIVLVPQVEEVVPVKEAEEIEFSPLKEVEPVKIWTPIVIKPKVEEIKSVDKPIEKEIEFSTKTDVEPYNFELTGASKNETVIPVVQKVDEVVAGKIIEQEKIVEEAHQSEELIPTINKNPFTVAFSQPIVSSSKISLVKNIDLVSPVVSPNVTAAPVLKSAMISSYSQDILAATVIKEKEVTPSKKKNVTLKLGIAILVISLIGGLVFTFVEGYLKIPWMNFSFSFVKKDPKIILLNAPQTISNLKSYKVETNISISSPSLSNITIGLASGEVVNSKDKDSISINLNGSVNHDGDKLVFDYLAKLKSSILQKDLISNWKYDGTNLNISIPDLSQIFDKDAPSPTTISSTPKQLGLIIEELSPKAQDSIKKIDIYNMTSGEIPLHVKNETVSIFKEFIGGLEYVGKGSEQIHGVDTYHYELTASRPATKKLLTSLFDLFVTKLDAEQKTSFDEALGASSINSFEVWVGKNDDSLYQINFKLNVPLSRVLRINDSGIAGNEVELDWKTTYYDLNVPNDIKLSETEFDMNGFIRNIRDIKIKNIISTFGPEATSFKNAVGSFGQRLNPTGSCTNPNPGSMFSPLGQPKGADTPVGAISNTMNSLLSVTNGSGACYSTSQAWALSAPLFTLPESMIPNYYCVDSTGAKIVTTVPITGTICK